MWHNTRRELWNLRVGACVPTAGLAELFVAGFQFPYAYTYVSVYMRAYVFAIPPPPPMFAGTLICGYAYQLVKPLHLCIPVYIVHSWMFQSKS
jgi:hypothetical protein